MKYLQPRLKTWCGLMACLAASTVSAENLQSQLPRWELGLGLSGLSLPHYPGADQSHSLFIPFPLIVYRGDTVRADRDGIRGILYDDDHWTVDFSIRGSLPVNSKDNRAREGMDDLGPTLEVGPQVSYTVINNTRDQWQLKLPVRAVLAFDDGIQQQGFIASPTLRWRHQINGDLSATARLSARFGDNEWHDYFYSVSEADARIDRPAYNAPGGYAGSAISLTLRYSHDDWRIFAGGGYEWLNAAAFENSPLVKEDAAWFMGLVVSKILFKSKKKAKVEK